MPKTDYYQKLHAKFKYFCIEQNREFLYSVVITKTVRKSNMQRNTQHRNIALYACISSVSRQFFKRVFHLKQINVVQRAPLGRRARNNCPPTI